MVLTTSTTGVAGHSRACVAKDCVHVAVCQGEFCVYAVADAGVEPAHVDVTICARVFARAAMTRGMVGMQTQRPHT